MSYLKYEEIDEETQERLRKLIAVPKTVYWRRKRTFDIVVSGLSLLILAPFMLLVALLIFIDDPHGSPIFKQIRIGRHGRKFWMYKFRTMCVNAEAMRSSLQSANEMDGPVFKIKKDPRVTRLGRILRKTGIDELMQFVNVLKGDMSMVGPRPPLPSEVDAYADYQKLRLIVTPGVTCYWQTSPNRNDISFREWVDMDLNYIEHRNMWVDLRLILKTAWTMIRQDGR